MMEHLMRSPTQMYNETKNKMNKEMTDFLVDCENPKAFDRTINSFGAVLMTNGIENNYIKQEGYYVMRVFGDAGFIKFAIENQGYGKIIKQI